MKQRLIHLMKHNFASQWMEMIHHNGSMDNWRLKIKDGQMHGSIACSTVVGFWADTPQGHDYWRHRTEELDNALGI